MAGALVGGAFLSAFLQVAFDRIASLDTLDFIRGRKVTKVLLKKLRIKLLSINKVLNDSEEKQFMNPVVKEWLDELKVVVYDAEDLLDEIATDALQHKLEAKSCSSSSLSPPLEDKMEVKLKDILDRLEILVQEKEVIGLTDGVSEQPPQRLPSTSLVEESSVYGRNADKESILNFLLSDDVSNNAVDVISIVGMGGVGKTTVAQLVYNDPQVKEHFDLKAWVHVSEVFDVFRVTKTILEAVTPETCDIKDLNRLQVRLKESLESKKFLIVLDDIWNESYINWEYLRIPFKYGGRGSKIMVTTRHESVASIMRTVPMHLLKPILDEDCWLLFAKHALDGTSSSSHPNLQRIGRKIVKKCNGLPLAAKVIGGILRFKTDDKEWDKVLNSEIWSMPSNGNDILPALRLSYHYLPSYLKRCFAYCALFPKGCDFEIKKIVLVWMAEGFLKDRGGNHRLEDVGVEYIHDLISRSLFQWSSEGSRSHFVVHDLIIDLAIFVSGEFCLRLEGESSLERRRVGIKTRHISRYGNKRHDNVEAKAFAESKFSHTFLPLTFFVSWRAHFKISDMGLHNLLPTQSCLRVLCLAGYCNLIGLPDSIGNLKRLRYLELSRTDIKKLPDSVVSLYNLQTLILFCCRSLTELPTNFGKLVNLRHLDFSRTLVKEMPSQLSKLRHLQTLNEYIVGTHLESSIGELEGLQDLRNELTISELQNVKDAIDASKAKLEYKKYLEKLVLKWGGCNTNDSEKERHVLDKLRPHTNLKALFIVNYGGTRFPDWLGDSLFCNMVSLELSDCKYCCCLPSIGLLPSLKELSVKGLDGVVCVGLEFYGAGSSPYIPFQSLEILRFVDMLQWQEWTWFDGGSAFPRLQELHLKRCPNLRGTLPNHLVSCSTKLVIIKCNELVASLPSTLSIIDLELRECQKVQLEELPPRLQKLSVKGFSNLPYFDHKKSNPLTGLVTLKIENCDSVKSIPLYLLPNLTLLHLWRCMNLESLTISDGSLPHQQYILSLVRLYISVCPHFLSFPEGGLHAPNLKHLTITNCNKLKSLPEQMHNLLPSLRHLVIELCREVECFPEGGLPSNLITLHSDIMISNSGLQRLSDLQKCYIRGSREEEEVKVEILPEQGQLPTNLRYLRISHFRNLKSLNHKGLKHLKSLESFYISNCPKLQSLPDEGLPTSLSSLHILKCPLLEQRCQREIGQDWPKIVHIPNLFVGR